MIKPIFLFASDDPETVSSPGRLMSATVSSAEPCRLYFDHVNGSRSTLRLAVVARNTGRSRATLSVSESYGGPGYDFMAVGHAATKRFLINRDSQTPIQREVAPGNAVTLYDTTFVSHQCLCGIVDYASDQEDSMELYVLAVAPDDDPLTACTSAPNCPPDRFNRKGKFDISNTPNTSLGFSVGAAHVDFEIGDRALPNLIIDPGVPHPQPLQGEYAIIQHALITIANPTLTEATVVLVVSPRESVGGIMGQQQYDKVIIIGHSFGAAIVIDAIGAPHNEWLPKCELVTLGAFLEFLQSVYPDVKGRTDACLARPQVTAWADYYATDDAFSSHKPLTNSVPKYAGIKTNNGAGIVDRVTGKSHAYYFANAQVLQTLAGP